MPKRTKTHHDGERWMLEAAHTAGQARPCRIGGSEAESLRGARGRAGSSEQVAQGVIQDAMPVLSEQHLDISFQSTLPLKACLRPLVVRPLLDVLCLWMFGDVMPLRQKC